MREPPPTGRDLDRWTSGLPPAAAGGALLMLGLDAARLDEWTQTVGSAARDEGVFLDWTGRRTDRDAADLADLAGQVRLPQHVDVDEPARSAPALRLAVEHGPPPLDLGLRLLGFPGVASVLVPGQRAPGTIRRRAWKWPLRIGVREDADELTDAIVEVGRLPDELVDVRDLRVDPGHVDVLVVRGAAGDAVKELAALRPLANAVVLLAVDPRPWADTLADLTQLRVRTGAVAVAVPAGAVPSRPADVVARLIHAMAKGHPFDVAVTAALDRRVLVVGERAGLARATVPVILRDTARTARSQMRARGLPVEAVPASLDLLDSLAGDAFEADAAADAAAVTAAVDDALTAAVDDDETHAPRLLQLTVGPPGRAVDAVTDNVLVEGANEVQVFIGVEEQHALHAGAVTDEDLGFDDPTALSARVTVSLVPLLPRGEPVQAEVDVPRVGRSGTARLPLVVPKRRKRVQARVVVTFRNRVLQTALLSGEVGAPAMVRERLVLRMDLGHLDERRGFDAAVVLNHDDAGETAAIVVADGDVTVDAMPEIDATTARVRRLLIGAATIRGTGATAAEQTRKLLVEVALKGNELYVPLKPLLDQLDRHGPARRIQVLAARPGHFLPLELVYDRPAPAEDAAVCPRWLAGGDDCGPDCFADEDDVSVVCPAVFWGLSRVVERHHASLTDPSGTSFVLRAEPRRRRSRLRVDSALVGASAKVRTPEVKTVLDGLGDTGSAVQAWDEWKTALADRPRDLLVLMPHTDPAGPSMEISRTTLALGRVERGYVTGGAEAHPLVVLFGCDTGGSEEDPAGYAGRFMSMDAACVFSTLTMVLNKHAAALSSLLVAVLREPGRRAVPVGDLTTRFRRTAVRQGLLAALAVTAYGDADWTV